MPWWGVVLCVVGSLLGGYVIGVGLVLLYLRAIIDGVGGRSK